MDVHYSQSQLPEVLICSYFVGARDALLISEEVEL